MTLSNDAVFAIERALGYLLEFPWWGYLLCGIVVLFSIQRWRISRRHKSPDKMQDSAQKVRIYHIGVERRKRKGKTKTRTISLRISQALFEQLTTLVHEGKRADALMIACRELRTKAPVAEKLFTQLEKS